MARSIDDTPRTEVTIDRKADVPVGVQLEWALCAQIREGSLAPGAQLPTLREMAEQTGLNVNTVRSVYARLERRGLIEGRHGSGTFVAPSAPAGGALGSIAAHAAREARETGLDPREVAAALYVTPGQEAAPKRGEGASRPGSPAPPSEAERRHALRGQITTLERTIGELEADHPGIAPRPAGRRRGIGPTLLTLEELVQVRTTLIRRLGVVQAAIDAANLTGTSEPTERGAAKVRKAAAGQAPGAAESGSGSKRARPVSPAARPAPAGG